MPGRRSEELDEAKYAKGVADGLDKVFGKTRSGRAKGLHGVRRAQARDVRIVVFSDLHRGTFDGADDFRRAHRAYRAALAWYLEHGRELWLLGDIEELWENGIAEVMNTYEEVLELERRFAAPGPGLVRFYGNHDGDWAKPSTVREHLRRWIGDTSVLESLRLEIEEDGEPLGVLFFVHGHQGTPGSDTFSFVSKYAVRWVWRAVQRAQGWVATTPAASTQVRGKHDRAMLRWAQAKARTEPPAARPVLVAGHTHHPVFPGEPPKRPTQAEVDALLAQRDAESDPSRRAELAAEAELLRAELWEDPYDVPRVEPPCYFNTGCSSFPDGDVTCIEIDGGVPDGQEDSGGRIRLVRWLDNDGEPRPQVLATTPLRGVLRRMREHAPGG